jgi:hypothetical protein
LKAGPSIAGDREVISFYADDRLRKKEISVMGTLSYMEREGQAFAS